MSAPNFADSVVDEIVTAYVVAAVAHFRASENGDHRTVNAHHDVVAAAYRQLRVRGAAEEALMPLLDSDEVGVRIWAGAHALEFSPALGEQVLESLSADAGLAGFTAQMTLQTWREGDLHFP